MQTYKELVKKHKERNSKQKTGWRYEPWGDSNTERIDIAEGGRVAYQSGQLVQPGPGRQGYNGRGQYPRDMLTKNQQQLIKNAFPDMKFDFSSTQTYGVKKYLTRGKTNEEWTKIDRFRKKGFKKEMGEGLTSRGEEYKTRGKRLSVADQNKIKAVYDLPEGIKKWDFVNNKYGIRQAGRRNLVRRMAATVADKKKWTLAADMGSVKGWMTHQFYRVYKNELKNPNIKKLTYEPVFDIFDDGSKDGRRIITGFKDNTKAGDGKTYYGLKKWSKKNAGNWTKHGDWNLNQKLVDITKNSGNAPNEVIAGLLEKRGVKGKVTLNYLIHFLSGTEGTSKEVLKTAIARHHQSGVAFGSATDDLALVIRAINNRSSGIEARIRANNILPDDIQFLKNNNINVRGPDGTLYGPGESTPIDQFKQIEKRVESSIKSGKTFQGEPFSTKQLQTYIENLGCPGKASGGRVGFATGTNCLQKGKEKLSVLLTSGKGTQTELSTIRQIFKTSGGLLKGFADPRQWIKLSNLLGPEAMAFYVAIELGHITHDVINKGTPIKQALGSNWATKWAMPRTLLEYQIEDIRKKGKLDTSALKIWGGGQELLAEYNRLLKTQAAFKDRDEGLGPIVGSMNIDEKIAQKEKEIMDYLKKHEASLGMFDPGSAAGIEFQSRQTEAEATRLAKTGDIGETDPFVLDVSAAKKPYKPMFGFKDEFKPVKTRIAKSRAGKSAGETFIDHTRSTYQTMTEEPVTKEDIINEQKMYGLKPEERLEYFDHKDTGVNLAEALRLKKKWSQVLQQPGMLGTQDEFSTGGRVAFGKGGMGRREFLGWLASMVGGIAGLKSGLVKFGIGKGKGKVAIKVGDHIIQSTPGMPDWYIPLVNRIVKEGTDVTKKLGTKSRETVHTKKIGPNEEVTVYHDLDTGNIRVAYGDSLHKGTRIDATGKEIDVFRASNDAGVVHLEYKAPEVIESGKYRGDKTKSEFSAAESEPEVVNWDGDIEWSGINEVNKVDDLVTDTSKLKEFGTKKTLNIRDRLKAEKKKKYRQKLEEDTMEQIDYIENKQGGYSIEDYIEEGARRGDLHRGADVEGIGEHLPTKIKKASGGLASHDNYLPGIDEI